MITDSLLTFVFAVGDQVGERGVVGSTGWESRSLDLGANTCEVARTMNLVGQADMTGDGSGTVSAKLLGCDTEGGSYKELASYTPITAEAFKKGERFINFEKLPLKLPRYLKVKIIGSGTCNGVKPFVCLTESCEVDHKAS